MLSFRPDVVHIASPATLGLQAARAADELGIPCVAVYQTDMIGFAERYHLAGRQAGDDLAHPPDPRPRGPHPRTVHRQPAQLEELEVPRLALWPRGVDLESFHPRFRDDGVRRAIAPDGRLLVGYVGRLAPEKELELLTYLSHDPRYALVVVGGGPDESRLRRLLPDATFLGVLTGDRPEPGLRVAGRVRAHRTARDLLPVGPGGARLRRTGRRAAGRRAARRGGRRARPGSSTNPATATTSAATSTGWSATPTSAAGWGWPPGSASRAARGPRSTRRWSTTTAT